jgi:hypothetical protein
MAASICGLPGLKIETWGTQIHRCDYKIAGSRYYSHSMVPGGFEVMS